MAEEFGNGASITTPFGSVKTSGWLGLASVGLLIFFGIQGLGVYAIWQLALAQRDSNQHAQTALDVITRQTKDWQGVLSQTSIEHRDLVEAIQGLTYVLAKPQEGRTQLGIAPPPIIREWQRQRRMERQESP